MADRDRVVLEGVDRYRVMEALFEGMRVVLTYRGEPYSPAYVQGISGAAFRIGGICPCAPTCTAAMETQALPGLFGYEAEYLPFSPQEADFDAEGAGIIAQVKDEVLAGRPALVWNAFTTAEWDVVCGFDEREHQFLGRGSYAGWDDYALADQMRLITFKPALGAILIRDKVSTFDARAAEVAALREAIRHARTRKEVSAEASEWVFLEGIQCYDRWVDDLEADPQSVAAAGSRYCYGIYRSTHRAAGAFLQELSVKYPEAADHLRKAAQSFRLEADALDTGAPYLSWEAPEQLGAAEAEAAHAALSAARDHYVRAIDAVEVAVSLLD